MIDVKRGDNMKVSKNSLKGYMLEEVLAYLIRTTGYKLLTDPAQDPRGLELRGNGLVVKGRGAVHQVDVLGELKWIPAFTFPLRLILEAKFRKKKTDINVIRNAVAMLLDVNQNNFPTREQKSFIPKYQYVCAVFSTSGFSRPAMNLAIAHQISLIDLSGSEYDDLRTAIERGATSILESIGDGKEINRRQSISNVRYAIRKHLETLPKPDDLYETRHSRQLSVLRSQMADNVLLTAETYHELFVGMANGPFMLLLKADDPQKFLEYAQNKPVHKISIRWSPRVENGRRWKIKPTQGPGTYELSFKLPKTLSKWIFDVEKEKVLSRAMNVKQQYFSNITIYRHIRDRDHLFRLIFDLEETERYAGGQ